MKFTTQFVALVAATAINAIPLEKRDCVITLSDYDECLQGSDVNMSNIDSICASYNSQKCQNFYANGLTNEINACNNEHVNIKLDIDDVIKSNQAKLKFICTKDESGNICPMVKYSMENKIKASESNNPAYLQSSNDTCKSKLCSDAYVQYLQQVKSVAQKVVDTENKINEKIEKKKNEWDEKVAEWNKKVDEWENNFSFDYEFKEKRSLNHEEDVKFIEKEINNLAHCTSNPGQISATNGQTTTQNSNLSQVNSGNSISTSDASTISYTGTLLIATVLLLSTLL